MAIINLTRDEFAIKLNQVLSASVPIRSLEQLVGRSEELETIDRALYQNGRHIFIYGDRGVGKSSLGATAAYQYQSSDALPIFVSGSSDGTFKSIIANIANQALGRSVTERTKITKSTGFEWRGVKFTEGLEVNTVDIISQITTTGDAVELLKQVSTFHSEKPIVVIDEFDAILDLEERSKFAGLLKQLGDQSVNLKFIFTGIGQTLDDLLGAHQSAYRQLEEVQLFRLGWDARREIVDSACASMGLEVDLNVNYRIAIISDGFPYYVHLIAEKMLWEAFTDEVTVTKLTFDHFHLGLRSAISAVNAQLKKPYQKAVLHRDQIYETIVWSTADGDNIDRPTKDMYESYKVICRKTACKDILTSTKFGEYIRKLKSAGYGSILSPINGRPGWYTYREKMLRGYVRMQAEASGIHLDGEREAPRQKMHIPGNQRTGYRGPSIPRGVRINEQK